MPRQLVGRDAMTTFHMMDTLCQHVKDARRRAQVLMEKQPKGYPSRSPGGRGFFVPLLLPLELLQEAAVACEGIKAASCSAQRITIRLKAINIPAYSTH